MHIVLTDLLTCPRCGPEFGLVVLADQVVDRDVQSGSLGCANCRALYTVQDGVADLRNTGGDGLAGVAASPHDEERAFRTAALLGVTEANHALAVLEPVGTLAPAISAILPRVHVISITAGPTPAPATGEWFSQISSGPRLPLRTGGLRAVAAIDVDVSGMASELARVLLPGGRVVIHPAPGGFAERMREVGLVVHLEQDGIVVAASSQRR